MKNFPLFGITVGGDSAPNLIRELERNGMSVSGGAKEIMRHRKWQSGVVEKVCFDCVSMKDLGFNGPVTVRERNARIQERGYSLCKPADGPVIRLAFSEQRYKEPLRVAMNSIADAEGPSEFYLWRDAQNMLWLASRWARLGSILDPEDKVVIRTQAESCVV